MPSSHLILCRPLLLLPPIPPRFRVFSNESTLRIKRPKYWSIYILIISWTCTDKGSINIKVLGDSADKRSPARPFTEGQEKRGHSSPNSNLFRNLAQSGFNRTGRSCPEPAADWPSAEHRAWALRKFSARTPSSQGKPGRVGPAALQGSEEARPLFASAAPFRWSMKSTSKIRALVNIPRESPR